MSVVEDRGRRYGKQRERRIRCVILVIQEHIMNPVASRTGHYIPIYLSSTNSCSYHKKLLSLRKCVVQTSSRYLESWNNTAREVDFS